MIRGWSVKNTKNPPGQVSDKTLGDYVNRKYPDTLHERVPQVQKKLTFDEWLRTPIPMDDGSDSDIQFSDCSDRDIWLMKNAWEAAQENK